MKTIKTGMVALGIGALVALSGSTAQAAAPDDTKNVMRVDLGYLTSSTGHDYASDAGMVATKNDGTLGAGISYEYRATPLVGVETALSFYKPTVKQEVVGLNVYDEKVRIMPLTLGVNFHLTNTEAFDLYAGPQLAYVMYGTLPNSDGRIKDEFTWGLHAGVDVPIGKSGWSLNGDVGYLGTKTKVEAPGGDVELKLRPVTVKVGASWKF